MEACKKCGSQSLTFRWQYFKNGTQHIRAECQSCGKYSHYAAQNGHTITEASRTEPYNAKPAAAGLEPQS